MIEKIRANQFMEKIIDLDTPAIVYNLDFIEHLIKKIKRDIKDNVKESSKVKLYYSCKANTNIEIIEHLSNLIDGFDVASIYEYEKVKKIFNKKNIVFTSPLLEDGYLEKVYQDSCMFDFNSISQLESNIKLIKNSDIGLRINLNVYGKNKGIMDTLSRFGINQNDKLLEDIILQNNINIKRIHVHTGEKSKLLVKDMVHKLEQILKMPLYKNVNTINIGGGLLDIYNNERDIKEFWKTINSFIDNNPHIDLIIEPGGLLVAFSDYLVTSIVHTDLMQKEQTMNIILDISRHNLFTWSLPILVFPKKQSNHPDAINCNIWGCTCFEQDFFFANLSLSKSDLKPQKKMIIGPVGAYIKANSKSLHDFPFPNEYYFKEGKIKL